MILKGNINIACFSSEKMPVKTAVKSLRDDIYKVTGIKSNILIIEDEIYGKNIIQECDIVIATKDIYNPVKDEALDRWEGYVIKEQDGKLFICGADKRGTVYGVYEFSQYIGVSPWYYFADVPVKEKKEIVVPEGFCKSDYPSVKYRGIFLNDEEELEEWAAAHTKDGTIGPELYEKIYELILRLKGNYIWPAMHVNYFQENPENARIANDMGVVVGTSHCDMLMRSNQNEWNPWLKKNGYKSDYNAVHSNKIEKDDNECQIETIYYDYSIPGKNRDVIKRYWRESIDMNRNYEVCYTIGMRGVHDYGFSTKIIDEDASMSEEEKNTARVELLEKVMKDQRQMLKDELNISDPAEVMQSFIPYKEVLELYDMGLEVPDDVTLMWVNDNFGHIRRYPNKEERKRSGGHGLYYHASYWGTPDMSYLFFNTIPLAHMTNELKKAYISGITKIWVLNVGALKPLEMDMEAFLQYGWDAGKESVIVNDIHAYTAQWFDKYFSGGAGSRLASLYETFVQIVNTRKLEHMGSLVFGQSGYGDEAGERVCLLKEIFDKSNEIYAKLPDNEKEAFFEMFLFKVHAAYYMNSSFYYADRSIISYDRGNDRAADLYTYYSRRMMQYMRSMIKYYNEDMCNGKWNRILTPDSFPPPGIDFYPVCRPSIRRKTGGIKLVLWDGSESSDGGILTFSQNGTHKKWIELGNQGREDISYTINCDYGWVNISETSGIIKEEKRIYITIDDIATNHGKTAYVYVINNNNGQRLAITIKTEEADCKVQDEKISYEADGAICIFADNYKYMKQGKNGETWKMVHGIGRGFGNAMMAYNPGLISADSHDISDNACLKYPFYTCSEGRFELEIIRSLTLDSRGRIRFAIQIDDESPVIIESGATDEWRGSWKDSVINNGEKLSITLNHMKKGLHTLGLYMIDNFVSIHKLVIYTAEKKESFFGYSCVHYDSDAPYADWEELENIQKIIYKQKDEEIIPEVVYADSDFWNYNRIYMKNDSVRKGAAGEQKYRKYYCENRVDDITELFKSGIFEENNGKIAIEAEYALKNSENAYLTPGKDGCTCWRHVYAETNGGMGLAMQAPVIGYSIKDVKDAPGMHFRINVLETGEFNLWLLMFIPDNMSDTCYFAVDGEILPLICQHRNGQLFNYSTAHIYFWCHVCNINISEGEHIFSVYACDPGLQIDRIYLSRGSDNPPVDADWQD